MAKFFLMVISVLGANLLSGSLSLLVLHKVRSSCSVFVATFVGMAFLVGLLYPLYRYMNTWVTLVTQSLLRTGRKMLGRTVGLLIVFLAMLALLYYGYGRLWFGVNIYTLLFGKYL